MRESWRRCLQRPIVIEHRKGLTETVASNDATIGCPRLLVHTQLDQICLAYLTAGPMVTVDGKN